MTIVIDHALPVGCEFNNYSHVNTWEYNSTKLAIEIIADSVARYLPRCDNIWLVPVGWDKRNISDKFGRSNGSHVTKVVDVIVRFRGCVTGSGCTINIFTIHMHNLQRKRFYFQHWPLPKVTGNLASYEQIMLLFLLFDIFVFAILHWFH